MVSLKLHPRGRVCAHEGCHTVVSIYNPSDYCNQHERLHRKRFSVDALLFHTKACPSCGRDLLANSDNFRRDDRIPGGFKATCKRCQAEAAKGGTP